MTRLPFCWRLTCSLGQLSLQLPPFLVPTTCSAPPQRNFAVCLESRQTTCWRHFYASGGACEAILAHRLHDTNKAVRAGEKTTDLEALEESELIIVPEVEPAFGAKGLYRAPLHLHTCIRPASHDSNHRSSRASGWILGLQTPCRICSHYSQHSATVR